MSAQLCIGCGKLPASWRGFCTTCSRWMGVFWRKKITEGGQTQRRRAAEAIQAHPDPVSAFGGGRKR